MLSYIVPVCWFVNTE